MEKNKLTGNGMGLEIAFAAIVLGIAGDSLLRSEPWGLNVPIMALLGLTALGVLKFRADGSRLSFKAFALLGASLFFASWFAVRDAEPLLFLNLLAMLLIGTMLFLPALRLPLKGSGVIHYVFSVMAIGLSAAFLPFVLLAKDLRRSDLFSGERSRTALLAIRGVLIAAPLVLVFGALFAAADASFESLVSGIIPGDVFLHVFFTAFFAWPAAGYLRAMTIGVPPYDEKSETDGKQAARDFSGESVESVTDTRSAEKEDPPVFGGRHIPSVTAAEEEAPGFSAKGQDGGSGEQSEKPKIEWSLRDISNSLLPDFLTVGSVEIGVVLGSLNLLFLAFVLVQLPYLFGGMELVQNQPGLKLSEYARRGFGELFAASILVLPVLMVLHWLVKKESARAVNLFRYLAAVQIGLLFVIMLSAFQRMLLLTGELGYGMTAGRFYPMAFMTWLAVVFLVFGYTVLRGQRDGFAWNAAISALVLVAALNFINPDDYIARTNLDLMRQGRPFDAEYNARLSDDAVPALAAGFNELNEVQRDTVLQELIYRGCRNPLKDDLRVWNYSRQKASNIQIVTEYLDTYGCEGAHR